jgi:hypothetical protein
MFTSSVAVTGKLSTSCATSHGGSDSGDDNQNINDMHLRKTSDRAHRFVKGFPVTGQTSNTKKHVT